MVAEAQDIRVEWVEADGEVDYQPAFGVAWWLWRWRRDQGTSLGRAATGQLVWLRTRMSLAETSTDPKLLPRSNLVQKAPGPPCLRWLREIAPGTGAGANKGFPNVADKTGGGQLAGRAQGARAGQLGAVAGGVVVGAGLANMGRGDLGAEAIWAAVGGLGGIGGPGGRGNFSPERNQAIANRQQYWNKLVWRQ